MADQVFHQDLLGHWKMGHRQSRPNCNIYLVPLKLSQANDQSPDHPKLYLYYNSSSSTNDYENKFSFWYLSEWLLLNANSAIFQLYHGENKLIFNEMMMRFALYQINTLSWIFIVLAHWNNSPRIDMYPHSESDTLYWFRATQSLLFLLNAACLVEKQQIPTL